MVSFYGRLLKLVRESYPPEEFEKYPDYSWLIYNLVSFISPTFPTQPPSPDDSTYWGNLFWSYYALTATQTTATSAILAEFINPPSDTAARLMFDLIPETLQDKFHMWVLEHHRAFTNP